MKRLFVLFAGLLPNGRFKNALLRFAGHSVHPTAHLQPILIIAVDRLEVAADARIGFGTVFRGLSEVKLGRRSRVGQLNWISAAPDLRLRSTSASLTVGDDSAITSRHYIDCSGGVIIGHHSTIAGVRSTFITHGIDYKASVQSVAPIIVGSYCLLSSNVCVVPGVTIPDRTLVGMGTTVDPRGIAIGGLVLAPRGGTVKQNLNGDYFSRTFGVVRPPPPER